MASKTKRRVVGSQSPANLGVEADADLRTRYESVRRLTEWLRQPLRPEDCQAQSMEDASPAKWHLAHTSWFFETFVLESEVPRYRHFHPQFRVLFNSYYQTVGRQHPRPERGLVTRPSIEEVLEYRQHVDRNMLDLLERPGILTDPITDVVELGLHHEQQHQELILTDIKHLFSCNPLRPAYRDCPLPPTAERTPLRWLPFGEGIRWIGHDAKGFSFDNERPRHRVLMNAYELASRPIANREFIAFIEDSGYERPDLWLSDGWNVVQSRGWRAPLYWEQRDGEWFVFTLSGMRKLRPEAPVCHVSFYEADAFAKWAGARLPSEAEWEVAAGDTLKDGNFIDSGLLHPWPAPTPALADGMAQLFGDVWEWTRSPYGPYPGYRPPAGALGEYNGKFMSSQIVLRGGSCATPPAHIRATYRNFFPPDARWQFSGIRLARDPR